MDFKKLNEELEKYIESNITEFVKLDKLCDLDKHLSESGRYIGLKNSKYGIYSYVRTTQKFNGSWNYDYKLISPEFTSEQEAVEWFAEDLLNNNGEETLYTCIKEGSLKIYSDKLNAQLGTTNINAGTLKTSLRFPSGDNKGIEPLPNYKLEPNKAKANNLRREYIQTHGHEYNESVPTWAEGGPLLIPIEPKERVISASEKRMEAIRQEIADILKDVPESEDVPSSVKTGWGDSISKWIKIEFDSTAPWHKEYIDKLTYAWFGLVKPDSRHFKPIVICSKNRDYHLNGGGWDYFSCTGSDDERWLPILEDALKAVKEHFGEFNGSR